MTALSARQARLIALVAQLAPGTRRKGNVGPSAILKLVDRLNLLQIDSVNVLSRSHYLPVFSRLGRYDRAMLDTLTFSPRRRRFFEYWAHEASFLPLQLYPLFRWRMDAARRGEGIYKSLPTFAREEKSYIEGVLSEIRRRGPLTVSQLPNPGKRVPEWWGWSPGKIAMEYLFWVGDVTVATRRNFERVYDLPERVIPSEFCSSAAVSREDATRDLMRLSARALGIATFADMRDYFRLPLKDAKRALTELEESKEIESVTVEGWRNPGYLVPGTAIPRKDVLCSSLLSPFDPLVWERARAERVFDFSYRIEIYTPAGKRRHGYYVLPFLHGDRFAARVCLKADRKAGVLRVNTAHKEKSIDEEGAADALARELRSLGEFLGLSSVKLGRKGDFVPALRRALASS
jgi:uncharacterized protein YcaQ